MIKLDIVSGFLGSGKTTFIKKMLENIKDENIVIIENEFGEIGIDGELIKKEGLEVLELQNGCICCSIKMNFRDTLIKAINKLKPDRVIIEPTGIGLLSEIITMVESLNLEDTIKFNSIITIVDGINYFDYYDNFGDFYEDQIKNALTIMISKSELIDKKNIEDIIKSLKKINKNAYIIHENWEDISFSKLFEIIDMANSDLIQGLEAIDKKYISDNMKNIESVSVNPLKEYNIADLEKILSILSKNNLGKIIRCKGFVNIDNGVVEVNYINGNYTIKECNINTISKLCIIGVKLNKKDILNLFK